MSEDEQKFYLVGCSGYLKSHDLSKFIANIERLNSAFVKTDPILSDILNRHNADIFYQDSNGEQKAQALGDDWLNSVYYEETKKLKNTSPLIRWANLISNKDYGDLLKIVEELYKQNRDFSITVDCVCAKFVAFLCDKRKKNHMKNSEKK